MALKGYVKKVLRHRPSPKKVVGINALERNWTFHRSEPDALMRLSQWSIFPNLRRAPGRTAIRSVTPRSRWIFYFIYAPQGVIDDAHRFTLEKLRRADAGLAVICAAPSADKIPAELHDQVDALYWKDLPGFDFSAYAIALAETVRHSRGADILVMNDSVFGPFGPVDDLWSKMAWDLTGFTASGQVQNHIQSYAFMIRGMDARKLRNLRSVMPERFAFNDYLGVVYGQETRFARVAARNMSVGALWYADDVRCGNPSIFAALALVRAGFPFLKRALFTKSAYAYDRGEVLAALEECGHPVERYR